MKKILLLPMTILLFTLLSVSTVDPVNKNSMTINIKNNANFDFYGIEAKIAKYSAGLEYAEGLEYADGSEIEKGEVLGFEISKTDMALDGEVEMQVFILRDNNFENNGDRMPIGSKIPIELESNKEIFFEITGDSIEEADLKELQ
ncbi:hypothetical protein [Gracilibacillus sp. Marseille-QA3620]